MTPVIHPGAERLILFHIVAAGRCWVAVGDGDRHWAKRGDVIVLPYGDDYLMGGVAPAERVPLRPADGPAAVADDARARPRRRRGAHRRRLRLPALRGPAVRPAPASVPAGVRRDGARRAGGAMGRSRASTSPLATTGTDDTDRGGVHPPARAVADRGAARPPRRRARRRTRLGRRAARSRPRAGDGAAPRRTRATVDRRRASRRPWRSPARSSTSASAPSSDARRSATSPSGGCTSPRDLLATTDLTVAAVARRVGYTSEEAFSRAFKRSHGNAPGSWRAAARDRAQ